MDNTICPFCNSEKVTTLKLYCAAMNENRKVQDFLHSLELQFKYGMPVAAAGVGAIILSFLLYNSSSYRNTFWDRSDMGFTGYFGLFALASAGCYAIYWGMEKNNKHKIYAPIQDGNMRFYDSAKICNECQKAWIPGFEKTSRQF
jgi:hypothetical protein